MNTTPEHDRKIAKMIFASVYPHLCCKSGEQGQDNRRITASNRMASRFDEKKLQELIDEKVTFEPFLKEQN